MSVAAREPAKRRLRAPARRERVTAAALEAFAAGGYRATSMGEIAARAGVSRAVLYDHFTSKKALFLAVLEQQNSIFLSDVGARITGSGTAEARMRETMDAVFGFAERRPDAWRLLFGNSAHGDPEIDEVARHVHQGLVAAVTALLAADAEAAGFDPYGRHAEIIVEMLIAALRGAADWHRRNPDAGRPELVAAGADLLWVGLGGRQRPGPHIPGEPAGP